MVMKRFQGEPYGPAPRLNFMHIHGWWWRTRIAWYRLPRFLELDPLWVGEEL